MTEENWQDILRLLAISVLIDDVIKDRELIEFCHEAQKLNRQFRSDTILCREHLLAEFNRIKPDIIAALKSPNSKSYITQCIAALTDEAQCGEVSKSIYSISICDYEVHDEECAFLQTALADWGIDAPNMFLEMAS